MTYNTREDIVQMLDETVAECASLRALNAELLAALTAIVSDIKLYHPTFDARLFVAGEKAIRKAGQVPS